MPILDIFHLAFTHIPLIFFKLINMTIVEQFRKVWTGYINYIEFEGDILIITQILVKITEYIIKPSYKINAMN